MWGCGPTVKEERVVGEGVEAGLGGDPESRETSRLLELKWVVGDDPVLVDVSSAAVGDSLDIAGDRKGASDCRK